MESSPTPGQRHLRPESFVGRQPELDDLWSRGSQALNSNGALLLIAGEPGIGKTRLADEASSRFAAQGAAVFWGRCYEIEGTPPYWPWSQILRDFLQQSDPKQLRDLLDESVGYLIPILPVLANRLPESAGDRIAAPSNDPARARFQLFDAIAQLLRRAARDQPLVLVLDDLQWADTSTLMLLEFLTREVASASILLIGAYRDVGMPRDHPFTAALPCLLRGGAHQITLRGLDRSAVAQLARENLSESVDEAFVDGVLQRTGGNPFFIREFTRWLVSRDGGRDIGSVTGVPASIRMVILRRLDQLSQSCREALSIASIIGRDFDLLLLEQLCNQTATELLDQLDEAVNAGLLEKRSGFGRYRFSHDLIVETIYDQHSASRRVELHARAGRTLEEHHANDLSSVYGELTWHFSNAPLGDNREKAITYALQAAGRARRQIAWEVSVEYNQLAVDLLESQPSGYPARLCDLLLQLAEAENLVAAGQTWARPIAGSSHDAAVDGLATSWRAVEAARAADDPALFARAALSVVGLNPMVPQAGVDGLGLLGEALDALPDEDSPLRALLLARLGTDHWRLMYYGSLPWSERAELESRGPSDDAVEMARRLGDPSLLFNVMYCKASRNLPPDTWESDQAVITEFTELAKKSGDRFQMALALLALQATLAADGRTAAADRLFPEIERVVGPLQLPYLDWGLLDLKIGSALRAGRFAEAEDFFDELAHTGAGHEASLWQLFTLRREQDRAGEVVGLIEDRFRTQRPLSLKTRIYYAVALLETGREAEARDIYRELADDGFARVPLLLRWLTLLAELAIAFDDKPRARLLYERLEPYTRFIAMSLGTDDTGGSVDHHLGLINTLLERWDAADRHFRNALNLHIEWGMQPYVAHTCHAWSEMLLRRGRSDDLDRATDLLDRAADVAGGIGMTRLLRLIDDLRSEFGTGKPGQPDGLTAREIEVLELIVQGCSNQEIASKLFISPHTAANHVANIMNKLAVDSRTAAATWALTHHIL